MIVPKVRAHKIRQVGYTTDTTTYALHTYIRIYLSQCICTHGLTLFLRPS